eukprot:6208924-Pleurochrysis_carterae.AAC.1
MVSSVLIRVLLLQLASPAVAHLLRHAAAAHGTLHSVSTRSSAMKTTPASRSARSGSQLCVLSAI